MRLGIAVVAVIGIEVIGWDIFLVLLLNFHGFIELLFSWERRTREGGLFVRLLLIVIRCANTTSVRRVRRETSLRDLSLIL